MVKNDPLDKSQILDESIYPKDIEKTNHFEILYLKAV
jgi:hypothetical protein